MNDDYLWDGSGEPDPEVQKLESALGRFRHNQPAPDFGQVTGQVAAPQPWKHQGLPLRNVRRGMPFLLALEAAVFVLAAALAFALRPKPEANLGPAWDVASLEGKPRIGWHTVGASSGPQKLKVGQTLVTDDSSRASISLEETGRVDVDPESRLRLVSNGREHKQLSLERGSNNAGIRAPPGQFAVDTPSAVAVDLGCAYTLHVDDSGAGLVRTSMGWVGFKLNNRESFIPAGAVCATRPKIGPGTPYFEDASAAFRDALAKLDFAAPSPEERNALLGMVLADAREQDALTLWHLLSRVSNAERPRVYDRLAPLAPPPASVARDGVLRLDQQMLDTWWNALGYGDVDLWRTYERTWSERAVGK